MCLTLGAKRAELLQDLSAAARIGSTLFIASDEGRALEALVPAEDGFRATAACQLGDFLALPDGPKTEIDIEGLAVDDGWLWVTGSHALTRPKVRRDDSPKRALRRIDEIVREPNRFVLARLPLVERKSGLFEPVDEDGDRRAGMIEVGKRSSALVRWVAEDPLLAPYTALPTKENGLDIEGLAVSGHMVWLGLRGPAIRGYAVVLQFDIRANKRGALKARKLEGGRRFRKYLLDLGGLAVRDLLVDGDDLLVLGGATTAADSPACLVRWHKGAKAHDSMVVEPDDLRPMIAFPFRAGEDAAEAITDIGDGRLLVLHDRPAPARLDLDKARYRADVYRM